VSKRDEEIIAKYASGDPDYDALVRDIAELHGGIVRVENDEYICADGLPMDIKPKTLSERWAEENEILPNGGWEFKHK
jgi:hypothetical protein